MKEKSDYSAYLIYKNALASLGFDSSQTLGRQHVEDEDLEFYKLLTPFKIDIYKIKACKDIRALDKRTQVYPLAKNPLIRNRLSHTIEVEAKATVIAEILGLNVALTSAIAWAHDFGHAPFGHLFERIMSEVVGISFRHEIFGPILLQKIERQGRGANLSFEVLQGISKHSRGGGKLITEKKLPLEYAVVMYADKIAYLASDVNDSLRVGYIRENKLPASLNALGINQRSQDNSCLFALIKESAEKGTISFSDSIEAEAFEDARQWMYNNVYQKLDKDPERIGNEGYLLDAYAFMRNYFNLNEIDAVVAMAVMTDGEVLELSKLRKNGTIDSVKVLKQLGFMEFLPYCRGVGFTEKDLHQAWSWTKARE
jgi:dGTPase